MPPAPPFDIKEAVRQLEDALEAGDADRVLELIETAPADARSALVDSARSQIELNDLPNEAELEAALERAAGADAGTDQGEGGEDTGDTGSAEIDPTQAVVDEIDGLLTEGRVDEALAVFNSLDAEQQAAVTEGLASADLTGTEVEDFERFAEGIRPAGGDGAAPAGEASPAAPAPPEEPPAAPAAEQGGGSSSDGGESSADEVRGLLEQGDAEGAVAAFEALEPADKLAVVEELQTEGFGGAGSDVVRNFDREISARNPDLVSVGNAAPPTEPAESRDASLGEFLGLLVDDDPGALDAFRRLSPEDRETAERVVQDTFGVSVREQLRAGETLGLDRLPRPDEGFAPQTTGLVRTLLAEGELDAAAELVSGLPENEAEAIGNILAATGNDLDAILAGEATFDPGPPPPPPPPPPTPEELAARAEKEALLAEQGRQRGPEPRSDEPESDEPAPEPDPGPTVVKQSVPEGGAGEPAEGSLTTEGDSGTVATSGEGLLNAVTTTDPDPGGVTVVPKLVVDDEIDFGAGPASDVAPIDDSIAPAVGVTDPAPGADDDIEFGAAPAEVPAVVDGAAAPVDPIDVELPPVPEELEPDDTAAGVPQPEPAAPPEEALPDVDPDPVDDGDADGLV